MNMLILGALFVVALLAIGGAVWLAIGERQGNGKTATPKGAAPAQQIPATTTMGQNVSAARPAPVAVEPDELVSPSPATPAVHREQPFSALNGQFYELAAELRALHRESQDIERRLSILTEMMSHIEREYGEVGLGAE